jgi:fucose 4-O-acetylase-like acetyltransferase
MGKSIVITNRLNWVDWAKAIAISFVVFGHIPEENDSYFIYYVVQFHMPLFFFISGYLTKKEFFCRTTLKKYWHTLIIPYFCYNILFYPYWVVRHIIDHPHAEWFDFLRPLIGTLILQFKSPFSESLNGVTWFIAALLVMKVILSICNKYKYGLLFMSVLATATTLIYIANECYRIYIDLPFVGFTRCLPFFFIGHICKHKKIVSEKPQRKDLLFCITGILISHIIFSYEKTTSGLLIYGLCFWGICISAITGILSLCKLMNKVHLTIIDNISIGTIVIMGFHWILIGVTNFTLSKLMQIQSITYPLWEAILLTLLYIAILYPVILLFKNKYPFMLGKRSLQQVPNPTN